MKNHISIIGILIVIIVVGFWFFKVPKGGEGNSSSGISGYVHMGPACPAMRNPPDPNCNDKPYANAAVVVTSISGKQFSATTYANGNFHIVAPAGIYTVHVLGNSNLPRCVEKQVNVPSNRVISVDISCDTGIR